MGFFPMPESVTGNTAGEARHGKARPGMARQAWPGAAGRGTAWQARRGTAWPGKAGVARHGEAWPGAARHGRHNTPTTAVVCNGSDRGKCRYLPVLS